MDIERELQTSTAVSCIPAAWKLFVPLSAASATPHCHLQLRLVYSGELMQTHLAGLLSALPQH